MTNPEIYQTIWLEVDELHPTFDEALHLVDLDEEEFELVAEEETAAFFRKVWKDEQREIKALIEYLNDPDQSNP